MLENILELEGAQKLSKNEQKSVQGGKIVCDDPVPGGWDAGANGGQVWTRNCKQKFLGITIRNFKNVFTTDFPI